jgi:hypothetical protein
MNADLFSLAAAVSVLSGFSPTSVHSQDKFY